MSENSRSKRRAKAFQDALQELRRNHLDEFKELYESNRKKQGLGSVNANVQEGHSRPEAMES